MNINKFNQLLREVYTTAVADSFKMKFAEVEAKATKALNQNGVQATPEQVGRFFVQYNMRRNGL